VAHARLTPRRSAQGGRRSSSARLAWALSRALAASAAAAPLSCANAVDRAPAATAPASPGDDATAPLARYRSKRLHVSLPLPDGHAWRIDDHSRPELVATHDATRSRVVVSVFNAGQLVGRAQCEELGRQRRLVPSGELRPLEDATTFTEGTYDTRIVVALEPEAPDGALRGHVMAFGGFLRKCYVFVYSTEVRSAAEESTLASRLALARSRVLGGLELDPFDAVARDPEAGPSDVGPPR
jgi:hypothetical protein